MLDPECESHLRNVALPFVTLTRLMATYLMSVIWEGRLENPSPCTYHPSTIPDYFSLQILFTELLPNMKNMNCTQERNNGGGRTKVRKQNKKIQKGKAKHKRTNI